jgi:heme exporter protein D
MIEEIVLMKGYGLYVWSAFSFTLVSFAVLYTLIKTNLVREQNKFSSKYLLLNKEKAELAIKQSANKEILANRISSVI